MQLLACHPVGFRDWFQEGFPGRGEAIGDAGRASAGRNPAGGLEVVGDHCDFQNPSGRLPRLGATVRSQHLEGRKQLHYR